MKNLNDLLGTGAEIPKSSKLSLLKDTRLLLTSVALSTAMALSGCSNQAQAADNNEDGSAGVIKATYTAPSKELPTEKRVRFEYIPSSLGIDYRALAPSPLAEMLSQGEVEWMENAQGDYEEDTAEAWVEATVPHLVNGSVSQATINDLKAFTPKMLTKFAAGLDSQDEKYGYLWTIGNGHIASKFAELWNSNR